MINVRQFCEPFVGVFESGSSQFSGIGDKTLCPGGPDISPTGDLSAKTWQPIFPLTAGPFRSRMCSPPRLFFFAVMAFFSSHICASAAAATSTWHISDSWAAFTSLE